MVICVKCGKEQKIRSQNMYGCPYDGHKLATKEVHAWVEYNRFIDQLRKNIFPFIRERIEKLNKMLANNQVLFNERMALYTKKLDGLKAESDKLQATYNKAQEQANNEVQANYAVYLKEEHLHAVKKRKQSVIRSQLPQIIGFIIGFTGTFFLLYKLGIPLILWMLGLKISALYIILGTILVEVVVAFFLFRSEPTYVKFLNTIRYLKSQEFADKIASEWLENHKVDNHRFDAMKSNIKKVLSNIEDVKSEIEKEQYKYNKGRKLNELRLQSAKRALVGSDEDLLDFYKMDKETINEYLEKIYDEEEGEW